MLIRLRNSKTLRAGANLVHMFTNCNISHNKKDVTMLLELNAGKACALAQAWEGTQAKWKPVIPKLER